MMTEVSPTEIPEFSSVLDFTEWYFMNGRPLLYPKNQEVFLTDDATASCVFRHGRFQVEIYLIHPKPVIPVHEHPGVSNVEIPAAYSMLSRDILKNIVQESGQSHGVGFKERAGHQGFVLISAQMWDEGLEMSTIGARWKGHTAGPKHEALIKRFNPDCLIYPGYADVTRKAVSCDFL